MRHSRSINHLGRTSSHRKAMLSNMAASLIIHKRITTTTTKAKALRSYVEPLITKSKEDSTHSRRVVFSYLKDKTAVTELFREISPKVAERPGGYTRILKTGNRIGDNAEMCIMELVDYNEAMLGKTETAKTKTSRRRRSLKKKGEEAVTEKTAAVKAEKPGKPGTTDTAAPENEEPQVEENQDSAGDNAETGDDTVPGEEK